MSQTPEFNEDGTVKVPNPELNEDGTVKVLDADKDIDYKQKFGDSTRENQRILAISADKDAEIERLKHIAEGKEDKPDTTNLFPGFEDLAPEEQENLHKYAGVITDKIMGDLNKNPAIAFAVRTFNEKKFDDALAIVVKKIPDLAKTVDDFKAKNFNGNNVPDNIANILEDLAKVHLFDKAKDMGADEERRRNQDRIDTERAGSGGEIRTITTRTLEDWQKMATNNPMQFAGLQKEYNDDLKSGRI